MAYRLNPMTTLGDLIVEDSTPAEARLAGNTTSTKKFLTQTGTGAVSALPAWGTIAAADIPTLNQDTTGKSAKTDALNSASTIVNISSATAPTTGQLLTATGASAATWQAPTSTFTTLTLDKLSITTGSNASTGTGALVGGTATISTTAVTANSLIFLTDTASSITNVGSLIVSAKTAGVSFVVTSTLALDTSTFNWLIIN